MILTETYRNVDDIPDIAKYHLETATVKSDELLKSILRVTTDHGNDYGIRLADESEQLENGTSFILAPGRLLVLSVIPDEMIVVVPKDIDEMGRVAHLLGNLHKPVQVKDGTLSLLLDKVVAQTLDHQGVAYQVKQIQLDEPLVYADLKHGK